MNNQSPLFSLNWQDALKGLIMAVAGGAVSIAMADVNAGNFAINGTALWHGAIVGGLGYLFKNFFTPAKTDAPNNPAAK